MTKRMDVRDIRQFDQDGIRAREKRNYLLKEGIIRRGAEPESFYMERANRLYRYEAVDRIILLSRESEKIYLKRLAEDIIKKSSTWRRAPDDRLILEAYYTFIDDIEIIDSEERGRQKDVRILQINLVSDLYFIAEYYISEINKDSKKLPKKLVRILAGLPPKEHKETLFKDIPYYDPKDAFDLLIQMTNDRSLIEYFEFFRSFFVKKHWNSEEIFKKLKQLLEIEILTSIHAGLFDLHQILDILHKSLLIDTPSEIVYLKNEISNYFEIVSNPEKYTDILFRKYLDIFTFLQKYEESEDYLDKLYFLEESRKKIRESENLVENNFVQPFKKLYLDILRKWMDITFKEGEKLLSRASLKVGLETKRALLKERIPISISIKNVGIGPAKNVRTNLHDSPQYTILGENIHIIEVLQRNEVGYAEFSINPFKKDNIDLTFSISYGDKKIEIKDTLVFVQEKEIGEIDNPYNYTKPAVGDMFFGRKTLLEWVENNVKDRDIYQNILIKGQRRAGKTSFLKRLEKSLGSICYCVYIDVQLYLDPETKDIDFLQKICEELEKISGVPAPHEAVFAKKSYGAFSEYIDDILKALKRNKEKNGIIFIFDEFGKLESQIKSEKFKVQFLRYLRGFFQRHNKVSGIISGNLDKLNSSDWKEFFTTFDPQKVGALEKEAAENLIAKPVKGVLQYDQYAVKKILDFSGRHPYYIQVICGNLVEYIQKKKKWNFIDVKDVNTVILNEAKETAQHTLELTWRELEPMEKNILYALSQLRKQHKRSIGLEELHVHMQKNKIMKKEWEVRSILDALKEKDMVVRSGDFPPYYDFNIVLFRDWLVENGRYVGE
jgi:hypothetical protein